MAPQSDNNPSVICPNERPTGHTSFNWNDDIIKEWRKKAIEMQQTHVNDNTRTRNNVYKSSERDALELKILIAVNGLRIPQVC